MTSWIANIGILDSPFPWAVWALSLAAALFVLIRRRSRWHVAAVAVMLLGGAAGIAIVLLLDATKALGITLPLAVAAWAGAGLGLLGVALAGLFARGAWRRVVSAALVVLAPLSAALGANVAMGAFPTIGAALGQPTGEAVQSLGGVPAAPRSTGPLFESWTPPADLPAKGRVGLLTGDTAIPSTAGFAPRTPSIYLPPAALVENAPPLPVMVWMMGQPGSPDPSFVANALDEMAAAHGGLAPIVIVADQLGPDENQDPVCADSARYGGVEHYFNVDIVQFVKTRLNVLQDPKHWTIGGYSNGGACAMAFGTRHPELWGNVVSASGDLYPGVEDEAKAIADVYAGDRAAYEASRPANVAAAHPGAYDGHTAIFTVGERDPIFIPWAQQAAAVARSAGFTTTYDVIPGAEHVGTSLTLGLPVAFAHLYPVLGLAPPAS